jgi:hypothetical protein
LVWGWIGSACFEKVWFSEETGDVHIQAVSMVYVDHSGLKGLAIGDKNPRFPMPNLF